MKAGAIVLGLFGLIFAFAVSQAHADQMSDLCKILNTSRSRLAALNRQIANERNPLKQNSLQQQAQQIDQQREASLDNFLNVNHRRFANFTGVVSGFNAMQYNTGPGVMLEITLPCQLKIAFQFIEITNPAWGNFEPESQTPLSKWRTALENIVVGDSVTFSGRFVLDKGVSFAVMTELRKKGGIAHKVPDAYMSTSVTATSQRTQASTTPTPPARTFTNPATESVANGGKWVQVAGEWINGQWVPPHRVWVPAN